MATGRQGKPTPSRKRELRLGGPVPPPRRPPPPEPPRPKPGRGPLRETGAAAST